MAKPLGPDIRTTKLEALHPESRLDTRTAYLSCCPGRPHDPGDAQANVLSIVTFGALCTHPDPELLPGSLTAAAAGARARARTPRQRHWAMRTRLAIMGGFLSVGGVRARAFARRADLWSRQRVLLAKDVAARPYGAVSGRAIGDAVGSDNPERGIGAAGAWPQPVS